MVERSKVAPLFHRSTQSFLREEGLGPCGRWELPRGDLQEMGTQSVTWTAQEDRGPSRGGQFLGQYVSDAGILSPSDTRLLSYVGVSQKQT